MSRYHWLSGSYDTTGLGGANLPAITATIPAGATMKRFLSRGIVISGVSTGTAYTFIVPIYFSSSVDIVAGAYSGRNIYKTYRRIPFQTVALYDSATLQRIYTAYHLACDLECAINEKCDYGLASGPGFDVRMSNTIFTPPGSLAVTTWRATCEFRVLYYL